ncbi:MAG: hypothetical protein IPN84_09530 [Sphingomonadales bacterium]|nr:hypothetical protein [Sphingomonadales bacterium]
MAGRLGPKPDGQLLAANGRQAAGSGQNFREPRPAWNRRLLRAVYLRPRPFATSAREQRLSYRLSAQPDSGKDGQIEWGLNWEEILGREYSKRSAEYNLFEGVQKDTYGQFEHTFECIYRACASIA